MTETGVRHADLEAINRLGGTMGETGDWVIGRLGRKD